MTTTPVILPEEKRTFVLDDGTALLLLVIADDVDMSPNNAIKSAVELMRWVINEEKHGRRVVSLPMPSKEDIRSPPNRLWKKPILKDKLTAT